VKIRWDNYRTEAYEQTEVPDPSLQITFEELRNEDGHTIARFNGDLWIRESDGTEWTDIAFGGRE